MRTILFTGKGGVGKTTLAAATALRSASLGHRTLVISTDIAHSLSDSLEAPLSNEPQEVPGFASEGGMPPGALWAAELDTGEELERYWGDVKRRIATVLRNEGVDPMAAGELAVLPGLDEVLALVRIKRLYTEGRYDALIIDSAPTGAAMRLLSAPDLTRWYARHLAGLSRGILRTILPSLRAAISLPIPEDAVQQRIQSLFDEVETLRAALADGRITTVRLVLNPDRMSISETQRAYTYMNLFGLTVDALFLNRVLPEAVRDPFFTHWKEDQAAHREEVLETYAPLPVFEVALAPREMVGLQRLAELGRRVYGERDPIQTLASEQPMRFYVENGRYMLSLRIPGVTSGQVDLAKRGDELQIKLGRFRRTLALPQYLVGLQPAWARLEGNSLQIAFEDPKSSGEMGPRSR